MHCKTAFRARALMAGAILLALATAGIAGATEVNSNVQGESLLAANPDDPQAYQDFARFQLGLDNIDVAVEILEKGRVRAEASADLLVDLGGACQRAGNWSRAESVTREALVLEPENVRAHVQLGEIYFDMGWPKSGLESFAIAVALDPDDDWARVRMVGGLVEAGRVAEAEDTCLQYIGADPENPYLWLALGRLFEHQGKRREAFTTYGQVLSLDPASAKAWARQGKLFCEFGQYEAAEESCRKALEFDQDEALAHAYLGIALSQIGDGDEARMHAQIAEAAGMNMTVVWKNLTQ